MNTKEAHEFHLKKKELTEKIFAEMSPLLEGLNYSQAYIVLDAVREKIGESIYFLPNHQGTPQTIQQP
jgi:hypothetical protein